MAAKKAKTTRAAEFGSKPVPAVATAHRPSQLPREWEEFEGGKVGWSYESRDWLAIPDDGRDPRGNFVARKDAVSYLTNNRTIEESI